MFFDKDLSDFDIIDKEAKRWKYYKEEIKALQKYMINNRFTRQSSKMDYIYCLGKGHVRGCS